MKTKLITPIIAFALMTAANAATVSVAALANSTTIGFITAGATDTLLSGTAFIYSSTTELGASDLTNVTTRTGFEALLAAGTQTALRQTAFTSGSLTSSGNLTLNPGDKTYLVLVSGTYFGAYQGSNVPALGGVTINANTDIEALKGTSTYQTINTTKSGFQLVDTVPEPSTTLLGAFGALALLRRRRN